MSLFSYKDQLFSMFFARQQGCTTSGEKTQSIAYALAFCLSSQKTVKFTILKVLPLSFEGLTLPKCKRYLKTRLRDIDIFLQNIKLKWHMPIVHGAVHT